MRSMLSRVIAPACAVVLLVLAGSLKAGGLCQTGGDCNDQDACTVDTCNPDGTCSNIDNFDTVTTCCDPATGVVCVLDDGEPCMVDSCSLPDHRGTCVSTPLPPGDPCDDGIDCDTVEDQCDGAGNCIGTPITDYACTGDPECIALHASARCDTGTGFCICELPEITCEIHGSDKPNPMCLDEGEKYFVDVSFINTPQVITGGRFTVYYDLTCLDFVSISPGGDPYVFEIEETVNEATGEIFYAVGIDPFDGIGVSGEAVLATISFIKIGDCISCGIAFGGETPQDTVLTDEFGQPVIPVLGACGPAFDNSDAHLIVPPSAKMNVDCDASTAIVGWDPPQAWSDCFDVDLVCSGSHESGYVYPQDVVMNGGELPIGVSTFCCTATDTFCGHEVSDCWVVEVANLTSLDVTVQLSPVMAGDVERCIKFELYADCIQAPFVFQVELFFGGMWDHIGHFTEVKKVPKGQWLCITAKDQLHSLRSSASLACVDGTYQAVFKGDPFFGGNWLIQGNLDAWKKDNPLAGHDVIDILDFGQFVASYLTQDDPNTTCDQVPTAGHADINGDGVIDSLDFTFITVNLLSNSKNACCPGRGGGVVGRTTVTVGELRKMGLGYLAVADLNRDGVVDANDMAAFMSGIRSAGKTPRREMPGSVLRLD